MSAPPPRWQTLTASLIANHAICSNSKMEHVQLLTGTCLIEGFLLVLTMRSLKKDTTPPLPWKLNNLPAQWTAASPLPTSFLLDKPCWQLVQGHFHRAAVLPHSCHKPGQLTCTVPPMVPLFGPLSHNVLHHCTEVSPHSLPRLGTDTGTKRW